MKTMRLLLILLVVLSNNISFAQWQSSDLPSSPGKDYSTNGLIASGSRFIAATTNGIYISDNQGTTWRSSNTGTTNPNIMSLASDGIVILAGTNQGQIFVSHNNGDSWQLSSTSISGGQVKSIVLKDNNFFAMTDYAVYASYDQGASWQLPSSNLPAVIYNTLFVGGSDLFLACGVGQIYKSIDDGVTWQLANQGIPVASVNSLCYNGSSMWAGVAGGVYKSLDNGLTWNSSWASMPATNIVKVAYSSGVLLANTISGALYVSSDGGSTWTNRGNPFSGSYATQYLFYNNNFYVATHFEGIYTSSNQAVSWTQINTGIEISSDKILNVAGKLYLRGNTFTYVSSDNAQSWMPVASLPMHTGALCTYTEGSLIYLGTTKGLYSSVNNGQSWTLVTGNGIPANNFNVYSITSHHNKIYLASNWGIIYTSDGVNWMDASNGLSNPDASFVITYNDKLYALSGYGLHESSNDGQSWTRVNALVSNSANKLTVHQNKLLVSGTQLHVTTDGVTYTQLALPPTVGNAIDLGIHNNVLVIGTNTGNVFTSIDGGNTWVDFSTGLADNGPYFMIRSIAFTDTYIVVASSGIFDVYRRPLSELVDCAPIGIVTGPTTVCGGQTGVTYTVPVQAGVTYNWSSSSATIVSGQGSNSVTVNFGQTDSDITFVQSQVGCDDQAAYIPVSMQSFMAPDIYGTVELCKNGIGHYAATSNDPLMTYTWSVPTGAVITSGQGTSAIDVTFGTTGGLLYLDVAKNGCTAQSFKMNIQVKGVPVVEISGATIVCPNDFPAYLAQGVYLPGSTFNWTAPAGATIGGQGSGAIMLMPPASGDITVTATNECGTSDAASLAIVVQNLQAPVINGVAEVTENQSAVLYSIPVVADVDYNWTIPADATIVSGQGTNAILVDFGNTSGEVAVILTSQYGCGSVNANFPVTVISEVVRPTASIRSAGICGSFTAEFYNLSGTFPLTVTLSDEASNLYVFTLASATDNQRMLPVSRTYTIQAVVDANLISGIASGMTGTFTTPVSNVTINPSPTASGSCSVTLTATGYGSPNGVTFEWFRWESNGTYTSVGNSAATYYARANGRYCVVARTPAGCYRESALVDVTVTNPMPPQPTLSPVGPIDHTCDQVVNVALTATAGYSYYNWFKNGTLISASNQYIYTATTPGDYSVAVSNDNTCYTRTDGLVVQITQTGKPTVRPVVASQTICINSVAVFTAPAIPVPTWHYRWTDALGNVVQESTSLTFTTPILTAHAVYYVSYVNGVCASDLKTTITAGIIKVYPPVVSDVTRCGAGAVTFNASGNPSGLYHWYTSNAGTASPFASGSSISVAVSASTTYYVSSYTVSGGKTCISNKYPVQAIVKTIPVVTTSVTSINICSGQNAIVTATGASSYVWSQGSTVVGTNSLLDQPTTSNTQYSVVGTTNGCSSAPISVSVTVKASPVVTATSNSSKVCMGTSATLTASGTPGANFTWYTDAGFGNLLSTATVVDVTPTTSTTYYLSGTKNGCTSTASVTVDIESKPADPIVVDANVCKSTNLTLQVTGASPAYTYNWYTSAGVALGTGSSYTITSVPSDMVVKVEAMNNTALQCKSAQKTVNINVVDVVTPESHTSVICGAGTATYTVQNPNSAYTYNWFLANNGGTAVAVNTITYSKALALGSMGYMYAEANYTENGVTCKSSARGQVSVWASPAPVLTMNGGATAAITCEYYIVPGYMMGLSVSGATTYNWGTLSSSTAATISVPQPSVTTTYSVFGYNQYGCPSAPSYFTYTVIPTPVAPEFTVENGVVCGTSTFTATGARPGERYRWWLYPTNSNNTVTFLKISTDHLDNTLQANLIAGQRIGVTILGGTSSYPCNGSPIIKSFPIVSGTTALDFDGVDDIVVQAPLASNPTYFNVERGNFTIETVAKLSSVQLSTEPTIVSTRAVNAGVASGYRFYVSNNGKKVKIDLRGIIYESDLLVNSLYDDQCHHFAVTWMISYSTQLSKYIGTMRFYVDGVIRGSFEELNPSAAVVSNTLYLGNDNVSTNLGFKGELHAVRLWNSARTASDLLTFNPSATNLSLYAYWKFNTAAQDVYYADPAVPANKSILGRTTAIENSDPKWRCATACFAGDRSNAIASSDDNNFTFKPEATAIPNPFETSTQVLFNGFDSEEVSLSLRDMNGSEVWSKAKHSVTDALTIGAELPSGVYMLHVIGQNETKTIKIIKVK